MPNYRRNRIKGGCYFFTVNLLQRHHNHLLVQHIEVLRDVVRQVRTRYPFHINAWVVLPDHMHLILTLPQGDDDYATRLRLVKTLFARALPKTERRSDIRIKKGERGIWQRRYWEHTIKDEYDYEMHMNYIHYNPVKHGYVDRVIDWPHSTFRHYVAQGVYPMHWSGDASDINAGEPGECLRRITLR